MPVPEEWHESVDVIVLGSGGSGLTAALVAAVEGRRALVLERTDRIGGTTAYSSGTLWVPGYSADASQEEQNHASADAGTYLDALVGDKAPRDLREAFLREGPRMMRYLSGQTQVAFRTYRTSPDYYQELAGASAGGQAHEPLPFDGRTLGAAFARLRDPIPELMLFGGMMLTRGEAARLREAWRSLDGLALGARLVARYARDRLRHRRGTRLVLGNALVARLLASLVERGGEVRCSQNPTELVVESGRVRGVVVETPGGVGHIQARDGVILAGGGFPANASWRQRHIPPPVPTHSPACPSCVGETIQLALDAGAALRAPGGGNAVWFPSSIATRRDGSTAVFPHIVLDRAKPGLIAVDRSGRRFANEAASYDRFSRAIRSAEASQPTIPAALVCDARFLWRYGLGMIRPMTFWLRPHLANGYLKRGDAPAELAKALGVDPDGLSATIARWNEMCAHGRDEDFAKGDSIYDRSNGDIVRGPNPCMAPLEKAPFYGVLVYPTPVATSLGLAANAQAQVLDDDGRAIPGLYVCGNDMSAAMGGEYQGPGGQLGPGMTFAYIAARHATNPMPRQSTPATPRMSIRVASSPKCR
ncbi:succinate dehydrogenase/fumarate reductase flavoprotein subunit [Ancylobacter aquaticus]|uniref:Succinate dehydrogenase/fumarate reductase flavoprotein subunit n=1 Tax=Ancylobacter aquaticus TaxID=100 RepID=A0A4R1I654_ANCAQ|nr:FAD-dependent oxidoreductase [Ancylobacter aquaticus]TCK29215.1 succinate dehydrogenase/fumarate reductase flavoprotein subunit [Ancylobacter aquaticus]